LAHCGNGSTEVPRDAAVGIARGDAPRDLFSLPKAEHPSRASALAWRNTAPSLKHAVKVAGSLAQSSADPQDLDNTLAPLMSKPSPPRPGPRVRSKVVRYARRVAFGHNLCLLATPEGGRYWQYRYRFQGREKLVALGCYPEIPIESARARHQAVRQMLGIGVDPADQRKALRQIFAQRV
jgi:hypothetical protein